MELSYYAGWKCQHKQRHVLVYNAKAPLNLLLPPLYYPLKVLMITTSNLTKFSIPPNGVIANLEFLSLSNSNPLLDYRLPYENFKNISTLYLLRSKMNASTIAKLPSTLVESLNLLCDLFGITAKFVVIFVICDLFIL